MYLGDQLELELLVGVTVRVNTSEGQVKIGPGS